MHAPASSIKLPAAVKKLGSLFDTAGHQIRAVGGWVRDSLQGIEAKDLDLATTATPTQMADIFDRHNLRYFDTGIDHGTLTVLPTVKAKPGPTELVQDWKRAKAHPDIVAAFEITTLRVDRETDGRHAEVEFTTDWRADAARRDFTINAMSVDLKGQVYDYFDGIKDLNNRRILFVGDPVARIQEDYLRILRYYRFRQRIGDRNPNRHTRQAIRDNAAGLERLSVERIWMEMKAILSGDKTMLCPVLVEMLEDGIFGEKVDRYGIVRATITREHTANPITVLAALTPDSLGAAWKLSSSEMLLLEFLLGYRSKDRPSLATLKEIAFDRSHEWAIELACMIGDADVLNTIREWTPPAMPVRGQDLIDLGFSPGVKIGETLGKLTQEWKKSDYQLGRDALLALANG